jgi:predicted anti-sigma-YlaC factor YlaD
MMKFRRLFSGLVLIAAVLQGSCSVNRMALNAVSNALSGGGSAAAFTGDSDPELVGDALPFAIKMYESLLENNPRHQGLILSTGSLFVMYANAFVQNPAQMLPQNDYQERDAAYARAKRLYLRGAEICRRGLELRYPGIGTAYSDGSLEALLKKVKKEDVPLLYWTVAGTLSAYSLDPFDLELGLKIPELTLYIARAYELDPGFNRGAIDDFYILFYASLPASLGGNPALAEAHYRLALEKSGGLLAGPYLSYAQGVCIPAQNYPAFKEALNRALEVDPGAAPDSRLTNVISQRRARYLLDHAPDYFIDLGEDEALFFPDDEY